jgi:methylated-DNA-[protein]-cysteine S-methyltransferase
MPETRTIFFTVIESPAGPLLIAATEKGLRFLHFYRGNLPQSSAEEVWIESRERRGELREFTFPLDLVGTSFQKDCWQALLRIPYGETRTYAEIAREIGRPQAFRAVGQANHDNPIAIVVPCHRVLGANGMLTGYGGGLTTKEKLLRLEGATFRLPINEKRAVNQQVQQARFEY